MDKFLAEANSYQQGFAAALQPDAAVVPIGAQAPKSPIRQAPAEPQALAEPQAPAEPVLRPEPPQLDIGAVCHYWSTDNKQLEVGLVTGVYKENGKLKYRVQQLPKSDPTRTNIAPSEPVAAVGQNRLPHGDYRLLMLQKRLQQQATVGLFLYRHHAQQRLLMLQQRLQQQTTVGLFLYRHHTQQCQSQSKAREQSVTDREVDRKRLGTTCTIER